MSKFRYILVLLIVLVITIFTRWLLTSVEEPTTPVSIEDRHDPDYFISDFSITVYDQAGAPGYSLKAKHLDHFPDDDTMAIRQLRIEYMETPDEQWTASSQRGTAYKNIEVVELQGDVEIVRNPRDQDKKLTLQAEQLRIDFLRREAMTRTKVKITGKNSKIVSTGLKFDLDRGILILNNRAHGEYVP